jgi:hypothetical protein
MKIRLFQAFFVLVVVLLFVTVILHLLLCSLHVSAAQSHYHLYELYYCPVFYSRWKTPQEITFAFLTTEASLLTN